MVHSYVPGLSQAIGSSALSCGAVSGPLEEVNASVVQGGVLWLAERSAEGSGERVGQFDTSTGACVGQLESVGGLERAVNGVAVGEVTGSREVYVGAAVRGGVDAGASRVAVFGSLGAFQAAWTGADTPTGPFPSGKLRVTVDESGVPGDWASGDVLISDETDRVVDVVAPIAGGGEPPAEDVRQITGTCPTAGSSCAGEEVVPFENPQQVTVDQASGEVFVVDNNRVVDVFRLTGLAGEFVFMGQLSGFERQVHGVAVDGGAAGGGDVYVIEGGSEGEGAGIVVEFALASDKSLGRLTGTPAGLFEKVESVAVDPVSHDVFVGDFRSEAVVGEVDVFGPDVTVPDVASAPASRVTTGSAVLNGRVSTLGEGTASCRFVWGTTRAFGNVAGCEPESVEGEEVAVSARLLGLSPGTRYYYRLEATSAKNGQTNAGVEGEDQSFVTSGAVVEGESATAVTNGSARLEGYVNPDGFATSYLFEYGVSGSYGSVVEGEGVGAGFEGVTVARAITGLQSGVTYHYRLVAVSVVEGVEVRSVGVDGSFVTQVGGQARVADGRVWELVSPADKHGAFLEPIDSPGSTNGTVIQTAADGDAITYIADAPTEGGVQGNSNDVQVFSARSGSGWVTRDLTLAHVGATDGDAGFGNEYRFFSTDLSSAIVQPFGAFVACEQEGVTLPCLSEGASEQTAFAHVVYAEGDPASACSGACYEPLVSGCPAVGECRAAVREDADVAAGSVFGRVGNDHARTCPPELLCGPEFLAASSGGAHVVLMARAALAGPAPANSLYEWNRSAPVAQRLALVSVLPEGEGGGPAENTFLGDKDGRMAGAISADGSRVFFMASNGGLYMRDVPAQGTIRLDAGGRGGRAGAAFQSATSDGSRVLFSDGQRLTENSGASPAKPDLYECVISEVTPGVPVCALTDLTPASRAGESAGVRGGVIGVSEDGSWVYFVADGVLENDGVPVAGAVPGDCNQNTTTTLGASCDMYVRHDGVTRLVAVLSGEDYPDWGGGAGGESLNLFTAHVSLAGGWLEFMSVRSLTGYDNEDVSSRSVGERVDEEVFVYDGVTGRLVCASCDPSGARPAGEQYGREGANMRIVGGNRVWEESSWLAGDVPGWTPYKLGTSVYQSRLLSDNGRLFFNGDDGLVPGDVNGTWDVYEWEPVGVGGCGAGVVSSGFVFVASEGGCVGLVSSGKSPDESAFLDASATGGRDGEGHEGGGDVFFLTTARLAERDFDDSYDVYDARECPVGVSCGGGLAAPVVCVSADACRAAPAAQPEEFGAPASATFAGPGNVAPATARRAVVLSRAQKLAAALKKCRAGRKRRKRLVCEAAARKRYGTKANAKRAKKADARRVGKGSRVMGGGGR